MRQKPALLKGSCHCTGPWAPENIRRRICGNQTRALSLQIEEEVERAGSKGQSFLVLAAASDPHWAPSKAKLRALWFIQSSGVGQAQETHQGQHPELSHTG